jgi:type II secretory pathway pseudopilin PulG
MGALIAVLLVSLAAAAAVTRARFEAQRERELQLLWVGNQYRQALHSYYAALPPNGKAQYPLRLDDLLADARFPNAVHHLRRLYPDPFTGKADWAIDMEGGRILGVYSTSALAPVRHADLGPGNGGFGGAHTYADWHFRATDAVASASPARPDPGNPDTSTPPLPTPVEVARAACNAQFGTTSITCKGPNFAMGNDGPSCRREMVAALDACLAAANGLQ